jgi:hypothetical protein
MSACTPLDSKKRRVSSGYSVDTRTPSGRSSTRFTSASAPTATTILMGLLVAFE